MGLFSTFCVLFFIGNSFFSPFLGVFWAVNNSFWHFLCTFYICLGALFCLPFSVFFSAHFDNFSIFLKLWHCVTIFFCFLHIWQVSTCFHIIYIFLHIVDKCWQFPKLLTAFNLLRHWHFLSISPTTSAHFFYNFWQFCQYGQIKKLWFVHRPVTKLNFSTFITTCEFFQRHFLPYFWQ